MSWADCFAQAPDEVTVDEIRAALEAHRAAVETAESETHDRSEQSVREPPESTPTRIVADADVLAADCCLEGHSRQALDLLRQHSWTTLVASDRLLDDAAAVIQRVADDRLATTWREQIEDWREPVDQPAGDHPALASAYRGGAMHLLSFDDQLIASGTGVTLNNRFPVSIRQPDAFALLFDPESLYKSKHADAYSGPDRDPRA